MLEKNKKGEYQVRTAHSLSPVPFVMLGGEGTLKAPQPGLGLANVAATVAELLEIPAPDCWKPSLLA